MKRLTAKDIVIIIMGVALIISFFFGQKSGIDNHSVEIDRLHKNNAKLESKNDSLKLINYVLDAKLNDLTILLVDNQDKVLEVNKEIKDLKNKKNEIYNYVKRLSADSVSIGLTNYLQRRTKSSNNYKY